MLPKLALVQGGFYLITGLWSLFDMDSFQAVTGPKTDIWLVRTVGSLVAVVGVVLIVAGRRRRITPEIVLLAVGCALALASIDIVYVLSGTISRVYLLDAAAELGLIVLWTIGRLRG